MECLGDLQGPKFRVGELAADPVQLKDGEVFEFGICKETSFGARGNENPMDLNTGGACGFDDAFFFQGSLVCVRACVRASVHACVGACVCVCVCVWNWTRLEEWLKIDLGSRLVFLTESPLRHVGINKRVFQLTYIRLDVLPEGKSNPGFGPDRHHLVPPSPRH